MTTNLHCIYCVCIHFQYTLIRSKHKCMLIVLYTEILSAVNGRDNVFREVNHVFKSRILNKHGIVKFLYRTKSITSDVR